MPVAGVEFAGSGGTACACEMHGERAAVAGQPVDAEAATDSDGGAGAGLAVEADQQAGRIGGDGADSGGGDAAVGLGAIPCVGGDDVGKLSIAARRDWVSITLISSGFQFGQIAGGSVGIGEPREEIAQVVKAVGHA